MQQDPGSGKKLFQIPDPWGQKSTGPRIRNTVYNKLRCTKETKIIFAPIPSLHSTAN
jgi:hypothetical protein